VGVISRLDARLRGYAARPDYWVAYVVLAALAVIATWALRPWALVVADVVGGALALWLFDARARFQRDEARRRAGA
jgi:hypothetical protein